MENGLKLGFLFLFVFIGRPSLRVAALCLETLDLEEKGFHIVLNLQVQGQCGFALSSVEKARGDKKSSSGPSSYNLWVST